MLSNSSEELPLTTSFNRSLLKDYFIRKSFVRDAIVHQTILYISYTIDIFKSEDFSSSTQYRPIDDKYVRVGIIGGGSMGKAIFESIHNKIIHSTMISLRHDDSCPDIDESARKAQRRRD